MARKKEPAYETEKYTFPSRLRGLMRDRGTRQKELADAIGMRPQTVSLYVQGQSFPDVNGLEKIARFFSVSADYLLGLSDTPSIEEDVQIACKVTGLSTKAVSRLHELSDYIKKNPPGFVLNPYDVLLTFDNPKFILHPEGDEVSASKVFEVSLSTYLHERVTEVSPDEIAALDDEDHAELFSLSEQLATIGYTVVPKQSVMGSFLQDACDALKALFREYGDNMRRGSDNGKH